MVAQADAGAGAEAARAAPAGAARCGLRQRPAGGCGGGHAGRPGRGLPGAGGSPAAPEESGGPGQGRPGRLFGCPAPASPCTRALPALAAGLAFSAALRQPCPCAWPGAAIWGAQLPPRCCSSWALLGRRTWRARSAALAGTGAGVCRPRRPSRRLPRQGWRRPALGSSAAMPGRLRRPLRWRLLRASVQPCSSSCTLQRPASKVRFPLAPPTAASRAMLTAHACLQPECHSS